MPFSRAFASGFLFGVAGLILDANLAAEDQPINVLEPTSTAPASLRTPDLSKWSWSQSDAEILPGGDIKWKPEPFHYDPGKVIRYIDFEAGSDDGDGSQEHPWKHHPWDAAAAGQAKAQHGVATYVFKRGVVYRGTLTTAESGNEGDPIRLTSDPSWGAGEASIVGSEQVSSWTKGADNPLIPDADKVYWADLTFAPRCVWMVQNGVIQRVELARLPNWSVSDPDNVRKEWWVFHQPGGGWMGQAQINYQGHRAHVGCDPQHLTEPEDFYKGAVAHVEYGIVMGTPFPTTVEGFDAKRKGIIFQGIWWGDSEHLLTGCHYYLEDKPQFLSAPGLYWFDKKGAGGRLYLRLPNDADPKGIDIEAADRVAILDSLGVNHLVVSGLSFRFTNVAWNLVQPWWGANDEDSACIRIRGAATDLQVRNCRFEHCSKALRVDTTATAVNGSEQRGKSAPFDRVVVSDNEVESTDHGAMDFVCHGTGRVSVLRNHLHEIGLRTFRQDHSHALCIEFPETMEVAGNVLERCTGAGLFLFGGKGDGDAKEAPFARMLVHHNKVIDALLGANDWGSIETWFGGPSYNYDNISARPNGTWWGWDPNRAGTGSDGFAFYHDHAFKQYDFNDIAYGATDDWKSSYAGSAGFEEATPTVENDIFNCTIYRFWHGSNWSPAGGRHFFLGNLFDDIGCLVFRHGQLKEDKGPPKGPYEHETSAYGSNVFSRVPTTVVRNANGELQHAFGVYEVSGVAYDSPDAMAKSYDQHPALVDDVGVLAKESPLTDPEHGDMRPKAGSEAAAHGVKVFVPWSLSKTVGEWLFRQDQANPARIIDNHWYMMPYYLDGGSYWKLPTNDLTANNVQPTDHVPGPLEDWCNGALSFNGKDQFASQVTADIKPYEYDIKVGGRQAHKEHHAASGLDLATPDVGTSSMIVEVYCLAKAPNSVLISKISDAGYQLAINKAGGVTFTVRSGGTTAAVASGSIIVDGKWHHVLAELDRAANTLTIFTDGAKTAQVKSALASDASLANASDFLVGKGPAGGFFSGTIEFVRVTRSSLAESMTSIEELYDWEFDGPFLRDFAGRAPPSGAKRAAGALNVAP